VEEEVMIATAATLTYDYNPQIVAPVSVGEKERPRVRYFVPQAANSATSDSSAAARDDAGFEVHLLKLNRLASESSLWPESAEPPSDFAMTWGKLVLDQFHSDQVLPSRVVASAEGGVGVCFIDGYKYADIECLNSGTILGVISDKRTRPVVWEIEQSARGIARASERISEFISASKTNANVTKWSSR
jgi:hypothetical protein